MVIIARLAIQATNPAAAVPINRGKHAPELMPWVEAAADGWLPHGTSSEPAALQRSRPIPPGCAAGAGCQPPAARTSSGAVVQVRLRSAWGSVNAVCPGGGEPATRQQGCGRDREGAPSRRPGSPRPMEQTPKQRAWGAIRARAGRNSAHRVSAFQLLITMPSPVR